MALYFVPFIGSGTDADPYRPKYIAPSGKDWDGMPYLDVSYLVSVITTATEDQQLRNQPDVTAVPANLDNQIGAALSTVQARLEALFIPAGWVQATDTYRSTLRSVGGLVQFTQRLEGLTKQRIRDSGVTLDTRWNAFPSTLQQAFLDAAADLGYDTSGVSGNPQLRTTLKWFGDQWGAVPFLIGDEVF